MLEEGCHHMVEISTVASLLNGYGLQERRADGPSPRFSESFLDGTRWVLAHSRCLCARRGDSLAFLSLSNASATTRAAAGRFLAAPQYRSAQVGENVDR
ncbi:hypothetical protein SRHO_G00089770 [Serrasalmus rhombeus]